MTGKRPADISTLPKLYIFEALGIAHNKVLMDYAPRPYDGDVAMFRAVKELGGPINDEYFGWKPFLSGRLDIHDVPGLLQNVMLEPNVKKLGIALTLQLKATQQRYEVASEEKSCDKAAGGV
jgi:thioesterase domain-containing protein